MLETWRWFGPEDPIGLSEVRQSGANGIVTALHETYRGEAWAPESIAARKAEIEAAGMSWSVVESIPVHPSIKQGSAEAEGYIDAWIATLRSCAEQGIQTICYNFMPVVDWTRTDLRHRAPRGGLALRFDPLDFAAYDLFVLARDDAEASYTAETVTKARARADAMSEAQLNQLETTIISGLPGAEATHGRAGIRAAIASYAGVTAKDLRANLIAFLSRVVPVAEEVGARLCLHPDDPPMSLFGLPRVVSTEADYRAIFDAVPSRANGITLCAGSIGSRPDNDVAAIARRFADRIHFVHLRNVAREVGGGFYESDHLDGDVDMVELIAILINEEYRRRSEGRSDAEIPMRPDHGHLLLDDINKTTNPGYSAIGRLKGLAELRGVMRALTHDRVGDIIQKGKANP